MLVYVAEVHPTAPDPSPYFGTVDQGKFSSNVPQPRNFSSRFALACKISLNPLFSVLVDDLTPHNQSGNNPVWCQWGPAPNAAWLIGMDGKVRLSQSWFDPRTMDAAIDSLVRRGK